MRKVDDGEKKEEKKEKKKEKKREKKRENYDVFSGYYCRSQWVTFTWVVTILSKYE